jgi:soluble lytic murein transglycosylase-like protein
MSFNGHNFAELILKSPTIFKNVNLLDESQSRHMFKVKPAAEPPQYYTFSEPTGTGPFPSSQTAQSKGPFGGGEPFASGNKSDNLFNPIISEAAYRYQVDPALIKAIIMVESSNNPRAVSSKGAKGLMQLMPATADALGVGDVFDPEENIDAGVRYFSQLLNRFQGNVRLALAAYNAGSENVRRYGGMPPFSETRHHVKKVLRYYQDTKEKEEKQT